MIDSSLKKPFVTKITYVPIYETNLSKGKSALISFDIIDLANYLAHSETFITTHFYFWKSYDLKITNKSVLCWVKNTLSYIIAELYAKIPLGPLTFFLTRTFL